MDDLVQQVVRHVTIDNAVGDALGDGGLADPWFADQNGVVLGPSAEDLQDPADFIVPADDRIEFAVVYGSVEVPGIFAERLVC